MGAITNEQRNYLYESWEILIDEQKDLEMVGTFYGELFKAAPEVRHYFPKDMNLMAEKLRKTFALVFDNMGDEDKLISVLHELGRYHKHDLGVDNVYYAGVVKCLLIAIKRTLGSQYTNEIGAAWRGLLIWISRQMIAAPPKKNKSIAKFFRDLFDRK